MPIDYFSRIEPVSRVSGYTQEERIEKMRQIAEAERERLEIMADIAKFTYDGDESFEELLWKANSAYETPAYILDIGNHEENPGVNVDIGGEK